MPCHWVRVAAYPGRPLSGTGTRGDCDDSPVAFALESPSLSNQGKDRCLWGSPHLDPPSPLPCPASQLSLNRARIGSL